MNCFCVVPKVQHTLNSLNRAVLLVSKIQRNSRTTFFQIKFYFSKHYGQHINNILRIYYNSNNDNNYNGISSAYNNHSTGNNRYKYNHI